MAQPLIYAILPPDDSATVRQYFRARIGNWAMAEKIVDSSPYDLRPLERQNIKERFCRNYRHLLPIFGGKQGVEEVFDWLLRDYFDSDEEIELPLPALNFFTQLFSESENFHNLCLKLKINFPAIFPALKPHCQGNSSLKFVDEADGETEIKSPSPSSPQSSPIQMNARSGAKYDIRAAKEPKKFLAELKTRLVARGFVYQGKVRNQQVLKGLAAKGITYISPSTIRRLARSLDWYEKEGEGLSNDYSPVFTESVMDGLCLLLWDKNYDEVCADHPEYDARPQPDSPSPSSSGWLEIHWNMPPQMMLQACFSSNPQAKQFIVVGNQLIEILSNDASLRNSLFEFKHKGGELIFCVHSLSKEHGAFEDFLAQLRQSDIQDLVNLVWFKNLPPRGCFIGVLVDVFENEKAKSFTIGQSPVSPLRKTSSVYEWKNAELLRELDLSSAIKFYQTRING